MNEAEIKDLYTSLPNSSFTDSTGRYHKNVADLATKIKSSQIKNELLNLWREVAGNKSPREWSKAHRTPILAMVPQSEQKDAKKVFDTIMANSPDERAVKDAIDYLEKRPPFLAALNDDRQIEEAFRSCVIGEKNRVLLDDNDEVRNELELKFPGDAYQWFPSVRVQDIIEKFAENKYYTGEAHDKVTARVMRMSDEDAKKLLIELIDKSYEVGLKVLTGD